ncbi:hypothetical protein OROHE_014771 [Orobanche hederae]
MLYFIFLFLILFLEILATESAKNYVSDLYREYAYSYTGSLGLGTSSSSHVHISSSSGISSFCFAILDLGEWNVYLAWFFASTPYSNPNNGCYNDEDDEELLLRSLEDISTKYPSFIGNSALIRRLTEDASGGIESKGCKIWVSESSMVASAITPGSIVSVSIASLRKDTPGYSLSSLADECAKHYGFHDKMANQLGNYFVLAKVFPSSKV